MIDMKSKKIIFILLVISFLLFGCSQKSEERKKNEEKILKATKNFNENEDLVKNNLKDMSDEELAEISRIIDDEGNIDYTEVMKSVNEEILAENMEKSNNAELSEIFVMCNTYQDPASKEYGDVEIGVVLMGIGEDGNLIPIKKSDGTVNIDIYGTTSKVNDWGTRKYSKGVLLKKITKPLNDLTLKDKGVLGHALRYTYQIGFNDLMKDINQIDVTIGKYYDDTYSYNYKYVPLWLDITFVDESEKEFRIVEDYYSFYELGMSCQAAQII